MVRIDGHDSQKVRRAREEPKVERVEYMYSQTTCFDCHPNAKELESSIAQTPNEHEIKTVNSDFLN